jgi:hypothetical protein
MKTLTIVSAALVALAAAAPYSANADSSEAMCEVRKDGNTKQGKSGPCTISQRVRRQLPWPNTSIILAGVIGTDSSTSSG